MAAGALLAACATAPSRPVPAPPPAKAALDASYDWHVLLLAPLGSVLKDIHVPLHEVLLFRDAAEVRAAADDAECFAINGAPPRFMDRAPDAYLLCFRHDRLSRIEAAVQLPVSKAAMEFADVCALWLKNAASATATATTTTTADADTATGAAAAARPTAGPAPAAAAGNDAACSGNDADIGFRAGLELNDGADALLSIKLEASHR